MANDRPRQISALSTAPPKALADESERLGREFDALADEWHASTDHLSVTWRQMAHPAYHKMLGIGKAGVRHVLRHLREEEDPTWFMMLESIARTNVAEGVTDWNEALTAWERWAQSQGLA